MHDSREIQRTVHERLHAKYGGGATHGGQSLGCHSFALGTIVWETLALLGEWELIQLDPLLRTEEGDDAV